MRTRRLSLVACLLSACLSPSGLLAVEAEPEAASSTPRAGMPSEAVVRQLDAEQAALYLEAEALYQQALARYRKAQHVEARELIEQAIKIFPGHAEAQDLRQKILAMLSARQSSLQATTSWLSELKSVSSQEQAVRIANLIKAGDEAMAANEYQVAHRSYDQAAIAMRTFSYEYDWGTLPEEVNSKLLAAENRAREADLQAAQEARVMAQERELHLADLEEQALANKVDEILRRARKSYKRRDFRRAAALSWNAYELDRRRDDARELYMRARRKGHVQFDRWYADERDERLARANEDVHKLLIPQTDLLMYPKDWFRRSQRKPTELGDTTQEPWMKQIDDRLEQSVTIQFEEAELADVIDFLRRTTGVNIIIATEIFADADVPPISLSAVDMKLRTALKWIMQITRLRMSIRNEALFISTEDTAGDIALKLYDISDLLSPVRDFPGVELGYNATEEGGFEDFGAAFEEVEEADPEEMVDFIRLNVEPTTWEEEGRGIQLGSNGTLFVSQTLPVHDQIEELLASLRNQQSLQVKVQIRLLTLSKTFWEDIGVDWGMLQNYNANEGLIGPGAGADQSNPIQNILLGSSPASANDATGVNPGFTWRHAFNYRDQLTGPQVELILNAAEQESDSQVLISPEITCYNGQRANASFVRQVAYIRDYDIAVSGDDGGTPDPIIDVLNVGNLIDVRPIVSSDRKYITMEVRPSSSSLVNLREEEIVIWTELADFGFPLALAINLPEIGVRTMRSTIMLPDKGSIVVGGLSEGTRNRAHSGVPFLSHIPFLGRLFGRNSMLDDSRVLYYMVTAEILDLAEREAQQ